MKNARHIKAAVGALVIGSTWLIASCTQRRTRPEPSTQDTHPAAQEGREAALRAICQDPVGPGPETPLQCTYCPKGTSFAGQQGPFHLENWVQGRFQDLQTLQGLASFSGCEPHSAGLGGTVVLKQKHGHWVRTAYQAGVPQRECLLFRAPSGTDVPVCLEEASAQGTFIQNISVLHLGRRGGAPLERTQLLHLGNGPTGCSVFENWSQEDVNGDGLPDLTVHFRSQSAEANAEVACTTEEDISTLEERVQRFLFDGKGFRPEPATRHASASASTQPPSRTSANRIAVPANTTWPSQRTGSKDRSS